ncbi:MAG: D-aminoacyl-tRNA deacylase [Pseudomonadales bacterium]|uniref:D-aminoacyl-tRNA deacylase n=1 Tax=Oleiphilus messinensis TaxID=141451 RepID=A0A1Y0I2Y9_9GAMM|nr:D-aminoacyl-tRNA deacylase [Oleiphilus messinensis]ARU54832.1 D-tyrosyl-tRNA(Tyr) deacylase [Oleiphilus messinensis]MCG8613018.1 D-aminoacyl-tRNA deacylase [Pseudomonadales bacterium]
MKALVQRVTEARVEVNGEVVGEIERGILLLLGVERDDNEACADRLAQKVAQYRIFEDEQGKMNRSLVDMAGGLLVVSQFTLVADTRKGLRPSFSKGAAPSEGQRLYDYFVEQAGKWIDSVATGCFGANMQVSLINDGPVTFLLET